MIFTEADENNLTPQKAAKFLGVTIKKFYLMAKTEGFPEPIPVYRKVGIQASIYNRVSLEAWKEANLGVTYKAKVSRKKKDYK